jgi:neurofibromin 1
MSIALRHIVPDIESELKQKLFDLQQPLIADSLVSNLGIIIDHRCLLADCLVAMFRLNPRHVLRHLFPACLSDRAPTLFKISLVKACLAITSVDECNLPWNPTSAALYELMGGPLRKLLLEVTTTRRDNTATPTSAKSDISSLANSITSGGRKTNIISAATDKKKKDIRYNNNNSDSVSGGGGLLNNNGGSGASSSSSGGGGLANGGGGSNSDRLELILDLLRLYQNDPMLAIRGDSEDRYEQNAATMVAMATCLRENSTVVRDAAAECLFKLHSSEAIAEWGNSDQFMEAFWKISSQIVFTVAKQLLDTRERNDGLKKLLDLLKKLLICRNDFLTLHQVKNWEKRKEKELTHRFVIM